MLRLVYPPPAGMIQLLLVSFPFAGILFAPSSLDCLFNGRAILLGKSLRLDSITLVRLSVKEPIDSETADRITALTEGSQTPSFRLERALASSESLMLKKSGVACSVSRPEGRSRTDNMQLYIRHAINAYCVTETPDCIAH